MTSPTTLADQGPAIRALATMAEALGDLPVPYITMYTTGTKLDLSLGTPSAFEAWRAALGIGTEAVELHTSEGQMWLAAQSSFSGATVHLSGHGIQIPDGQAAEGGDAP